MNKFDFEKKLVFFLKNNSVFFKENLELKFETQFKTGGVCRFYIMPGDVSALVLIINFLKEHEESFKIIGGTTNLVFFNELSYGVLVSTKLITDVTFSEGEVSVGAGYLTSDYVRVRISNGYAGAEGLEGIPGTIGGAVFMNAGAYGYAISDDLISVVVLDQDGVVRELSKSDCNFRYRGSLFKDNPELTILTARFILHDGDQALSADKVEVYHIARHSYQEFCYPNLGSLFSSDGDIYSAIFRSSKLYYSAMVFLKLILRNRLSKWLLRKRPNNRYLNGLVYSFVPGIDRRLFSKKSVNILVNKFGPNSSDIINHVAAIKEKLHVSIKIENEFVVHPLYGNSDKYILDKIASIR